MVRNGGSSRIQGDHREDGQRQDECCDYQRVGSKGIGKTGDNGHVKKSTFDQIEFKYRLDHVKLTGVVQIRDFAAHDVVRKMELVLG